MTPQQAIDWVEKLGIALESGRGPVPNLAEEQIKAEITRLTRAA